MVSLFLRLYVKTKYRRCNKQLPSFLLSIEEAYKYVHNNVIQILSKKSYEI